MGWQAEGKAPGKAGDPAGQCAHSGPREVFATPAAQAVPQGSQGLRQSMELAGKEAMNSDGNRGKHDVHGAARSWC